MTDWAVHVPLDYTFSRVIPQSLAAAQAVAGLSDEQLREAGNPNDLKAVQDLRLVSLTDPWFRGRNKSYEIIR
jgi:hypothetical protein